MAAALVLGRLLLAAVFAVAAVAKTRDLPGTRRAVAAFGVPPRLVAAAALALPAAELAVAAGLAAEPTAGGAALAGCGLLAAFAVGIAANLARGRTPECNCFGRLRSEPVGRATLLRNVALAALAAAIALGEAPAPAAVPAGLLAVAAGALAVGWARDPARAAAVAPEGLPVGATAPPSGIAANGRPVLLVFTDRGCGPCLELRPDLELWRAELADELRIEVLENADALADAYAVGGTPTAVLVGRDGLVAAEAAAGRTAIESLLARTVPGFDPKPTGAGLSGGGRGTGLRRRELIVRAGSAWAASSFIVAWPARAARDLRNGRRPCPKPSQLRCGGECVSVLTDRRHCGTRCDNLKRCRSSLPGNVGYREVCAGGRCIRDTDGSLCNAARGGSGSRGLGNPPPNQCGGGLVCCQGNCVDPTRAPNCGGCGGTATGQRPACCEGARRDLQSDPRHCGRCFNRCPDDKPTCYAPPGTPMDKVCRKNCPDPLFRCSDKCHNPDTELCCGGNVYTIAALPPNAECCDGQIEIRPPGSFFCP